MKGTSLSLGTDKIFSVILIASSAVFYSMLGGMDPATSEGEIAASTYPRLLLIGVIISCGLHILSRNNEPNPVAQFPIAGGVVIGLIGSYIYLVDIIGYFLLTPVLLFALPVIAGFKNYKAITFSVLFITFTLYGVFDLVLNIPLPNGFLGE